MSNTYLSQQNTRHPKKDERYSKEFDELVESYNAWLSEAEHSRCRLNVKAFLRGAANSFNIFGGTYRNLNDINSEFDPIYSKGLSSDQRTIIRMASDWKRVNIELTDIISGKIVDPLMPVDAAKASQEVCSKIYSDWRDTYVKSREYSVKSRL